MRLTTYRSSFTVSKEAPEQGWQYFLRTDGEPLGAQFASPLPKVFLKTQPRCAHPTALRHVPCAVAALLRGMLGEQTTGTFKVEVEWMGLPAPKPSE